MEIGEMQKFVAAIVNDKLATMNSVHPSINDHHDQSGKYCATQLFRCILRT